MKKASSGDALPRAFDKLALIAPRFRTLPDGTKVEEPDEEDFEQEQSPAKAQKAVTPPAAAAAPSELAPAGPVVNPLESTRWAALFSNPHDFEQSVTIDGVTARRIGAYRPPEEVLFPPRGEGFYSDRKTYRFEVSRPLLYPEDRDVWWDRDEARIGFDAPFDLLYDYGQHTVSINTSSTGRFGLRALWLGRLLVAAGEIGAALDAQAAVAMQSERYKEGMRLKQKKREADIRAREEWEAGEPERQRKKAEEEARKRAEEMSARRSEGAKKAARTRRLKAAQKEEDEAQSLMNRLEMSGAATEEVQRARRIYQEKLEARNAIMAEK